MPPSRWRDFDPGDKMRATWTDAIEESLHNYVSPNFHVGVDPADATVVKVTAPESFDGANDVIVAHVAGKPRWNDDNDVADATHPGGAAGSYVYWITAGPDEFIYGVNDEETNDTDHQFYGLITTSGGAPSGAGTQTYGRKIAIVRWDGAAIVGVIPLIGVGGGDPTVAHSPGDLKATARSTAPAGWLFCDGAAVSRDLYAELFAAIGTVYGAGDGTTTFNLPDLRGRVPVGVDGSAGRLTGSDGLGESGGFETIALTLAQIPAHTHGVQIRGIGGAAVVGVEVSGGTDAGFQTTTSQGSGNVHNNVQPYQVVNWMVKI